MYDYDLFFPILSFGCGYDSIGYPEGKRKKILRILLIVALSEQQFFCCSLTCGKISTRTWYTSLSYVTLPLPKRQK